jgi:hypothetical protein
VGEEEPTAGVVRVRICLTELVVDPVVSDPVEDRVLLRYVYTVKMYIRRYTKQAKTSVLVYRRVAAMSCEWEISVCPGIVPSLSSNICLPI